MQEKKRGKIKAVKCPYCRDKYMILRKGQAMNFRGEEKGTWHCKNCVHVWDEDWFDIFPQHEDCVTRYPVT